MPIDPFAISDPFALADPFSGVFGSSGFRRPRAIPAMTREEAESSLKEKLGSVVGGLGYIGDVLDKTFGARAIRGALGGRPRELLSILPGSDIIGLTNPSQTVSGDDLAQQWGLLEGPGETGTFELRDLVGPAIEIGLDPTTYLTLGAGALSKAGFAAKKAGQLEKTLAGRIRSGQGGLAAIGIPFTEIQKPIGTGETALKVAEWLGDKADIAKYSLPGRALSAMFDPTVEGALSEVTQRELRGIADQKRAAQVSAEEAMLGAKRKLSEAGLDTPEVDAQIRAALEGQMSFLPGTVEGDVVADLRKRLDDQFLKERLAGIDTPFLADYAPRQKTLLDEPTKGYGKGDRFAKAEPLSTIHSSLRGREDIFQGLATRDINQIVKDLRLSGPERTLQSGRDPLLLGLPAATPEAREMAKRQVTKRNDVLAEAEVIRREYLGMSPADEANRFRLNAIDDASLSADDLAIKKELNRKYDQSLGLADFVAKVDPQYASKQLDFFGNSIFKDVADRLAKGGKTEARAAAITRALVKGAVPRADAPEGFVRVGELLTKIPLTDQAFKNPNVLKDIEALGKNAGDLTGMYISKEMADDLTRYVQGFTRPEALEPFLNAWDSMTALMKAGLTAVWPAKYTRDFAQGQFQNFLEMNPAEWFASTRDAIKVIRHGQTLEGASAIAANLGKQGLDDAAATKWLVDQYAAREGFFTKKPGRSVAEISEHERQMSLGLPGEKQETLLDIAKGLAPSKVKEAGMSWNPLDIPGVGISEPRRTTKFAPVAAGFKVGEMVDDVNRFGLFLGKLRQGWSLDAAYDTVVRRHYDFSQLTGFEKSAMRRLILFYCVPDHSEILTRDGWKTCDELQQGEEVLTYSMEKDCLEWQPCKEKSIFDYDDELLVWESDRYKLEFTPNHRWPIRLKGGTIKRPYGTYEYPDRHKVVLGEELRSNHSFIVTAQYHGDGDSLLTPDQARLLGWIVTDGCVQKRRRNFVSAVIYQSPKKFLEEVKHVAGGTCYAPHPDSGVVSVGVLKSRKEELLPYLDKENLISVVTRLSRDAAEAMYDAMYKGDGAVSEKRSGDHFAAENPHVRDAFRVLAFMLGKRTSKSNRGPYISNRRYMKVREGVMVRVPYKGRVWCPSTENGTWVMRQNDLITITGNSWQRQNVPAVIRELFERPGGKMATTLKVGESMRQEEGFVPPQAGQGLAIPLSQEEDGRQRYFGRIGLNYEDAFNLLDSPTAILGQLSPMLKYPLEQATGKQMMTGRELQDLSRNVTNIPGVDDLLAEYPWFANLLMNSPASRVVSSVRTALDPRKDLAAIATNLLSPGRITDVDMAQARSIAGKQAIEQQLAGNRDIGQFSRLYPKNLQALSPSDLELLRLYSFLEEEQKKRNRAKKQAAVQ